MDADEYTDWIARSQVKPLPDTYWQAGLISSTVASCAMGARKSWKPTDFMPYETPKSENSWKATQAKMMMFCGMSQAKAKEAEK